MPFEPDFDPVAVLTCRILGHDYYWADMKAYSTMCSRCGYCPDIYPGTYGHHYASTQ